MSAAIRVLVLALQVHATAGCCTTVFRPVRPLADPGSDELRLERILITDASHPTLVADLDLPDDIVTVDTANLVVVDSSGVESRRSSTRIDDGDWLGLVDGYVNQPLPEGRARDDVRGTRVWLPLWVPVPGDIPPGAIQRTGPDDRLMAVSVVGTAVGGDQVELSAPLPSEQDEWRAGDLGLGIALSARHFVRTKEHPEKEQPEWTIGSLRVYPRAGAWRGSAELGYGTAGRGGTMNSASAGVGRVFSLPYRADAVWRHAIIPEVYWMYDVRLLDGKEHRAQSLIASVAVGGMDPPFPTNPGFTGQREHGMFELGFFVCRRDDGSETPETIVGFSFAVATYSWF